MWARSWRGEMHLRNYLKNPGRLARGGKKNKYGLKNNRAKRKIPNKPKKNRNLCTSPLPKKACTPNNNTRITNNISWRMKQSNSSAIKKLLSVCHRLAVKKNPFRYNFKTEPLRDWWRGKQYVKKSKSTDKFREETINLSFSHIQKSSENGSQLPFKLITLD